MTDYYPHKQPLPQDFLVYKDTGWTGERWTIEHTSPVVKWLEDNVGCIEGGPPKYTFTIITDTVRTLFSKQLKLSVVCFMFEEDAILYKLAWCGETE